MPRRLTSLDVREVSFVGRPANKRKFAIIKADEAEEGASMDQELRNLFDALTDSLEAGAFDAAVEDLERLREAVEKRLGEDEGEGQKAARRRREDEEEREEDYGYSPPRRKPTTKSANLVEEMAARLVEKSAGTSQPLTKEAAVKRVLALHPDLWEDHSREFYARAGR